MAIWTNGTKSSSSFKTRIGCSSSSQPHLAVDELYDAIHQDEEYTAVFFCSSSYDLDELARCINARFSSQIIGCTSAGQIDNAGYHDQSLVGVSIPVSHIAIKSFLLDDIASFNHEQAIELAGQFATFEADESLSDAKGKMGMLLIDGLCMREELTLSMLENAIPEIPIVGGSAADDLNFSETHVFHEGRFLKNAAVLAIIHTDLPFKMFKIQHFLPQATRLVITEADPVNRTVMKINGAPAALEYAKAVGKSVEELTTDVYSSHPLMLKIGGEYYVRSIMRTNPDLSMQFACAIDNGLVLRIGEGVGLVNSLEHAIDQLKQDMPSLEMILGFDCAFRKLEVINKGLEQDIAKVLNGSHFIGFNTYGEQINSLHVNQTLTGLAFGTELMIEKDAV